MKSELEYLVLAFAEWIKANGASKHLPVTPYSVYEVLVTANKLRKADADKLEQATA
jgi:hypothetical protein